MDQANYQLAWHLAERLGRRVHLVAHQVATPLAEHANVRVHLVGRPLGLHVLGELLLDRAGRRVAQRLRSHDPRTRVVVNGGNCLAEGVNWVHMVHHACAGADRGAPWSFRLKHRLTRVRDRRRERRALRASSLVVANSHKTRRELLDLVGLPAERIRVVHLAAHAEQFRPASPEERRAARLALSLSPDEAVLLFVGALGYDRNKGLDTLLLAWRRLADAGLPLGRLLVAGGGRLPFWQRQVDELGLTRQVRFVGHTEGIAGLMHAADVLVSPTRYDAYGLAVHEALCCGLPALVSQAAGVAERYPPELQDLVLPDPEDVEDLARRIARCRESLESFRRRAAAFGAVLRSRSWHDVAAEIVTLVEEAEGGDKRVG
jgi:glycosyltransferase involved in cell wall biosynthesis